MLKRLICWLTAGMLVLGTLPAEAWRFGTTGGSPAPVTCPQGSGAADNGCSGANQNSFYQDITLLSSTQADGSNTLLPLHITPANGIVPFNIPAVDYPIGPDKTLTPQDPRTVSIPHCSYDSGSNYFLCYPSSNGEVIHVVIDNVDFSGAKIGKAPVSVFLGGCGSGCGPGAGTTATITNSYFAITSTVTPLGFGGGGTTGNWSVVYKYNQCDGAQAVKTSGFCIGSSGDLSGTSVDIEYSVFSNQGVGRIAGGFRYMTWTFKYNFVQGLNDLATTNHGELMLRTCSQTGCTSFDDYEGNFIVWNPPSTSGLNNATIFPGDGAVHLIRLSSVTFSNNVVVTNKNGSTTVIDQAMFNANLSSLGVVNMNSNWVNAHGSNGCSINGVKSGGSSVGASQSGTVITISSLSSSFNNNPIGPGWQFYRSGILVATILTMGTSVGNTGTVNVDTSATIEPDSNWTLVPGFTSLTANDNYNLYDPSHTGTPSAMNISGPQMTAGTCPHG